MPQPYCHHINSAGVFCRGIPVKNRDYCYWHLHENGRRMKAARARARSQRVSMQLPVLDDLHAVQVGMMQLGEAVRYGEIDHRTGRLLLAILRLAASNIKARDIWEREAEMQDGDVTQYVDEDDGFEEQYGLPEDFDLSVEPEVAFPPPPTENVPRSATYLWALTWATQLTTICARGSARCCTRLPGPFPIRTFKPPPMIWS